MNKAGAARPPLPASGMAMRRTLILTSILLLTLAAAASRLIASGAVAESLRARLVDDAARALGRYVAVARVGGDPWRGFVLDGVRIASGPSPQSGRFIEAPRITVHVHIRRLLSDLLAGRGIIPSITAVELDRPYLVIARDALGQWNYADLFGPQPGPGAPAFTARIEAHEGRLIVADALHLHDPFVAHFERVTGTVDFARAPRVRIVLDAVNTDGVTPALLRAAGTAVIGTDVLDLDLSTRGASVSHWGRYLVRLPWLVWAGGTFDGTVQVLTSRWQGHVAVDYRGRLTMRAGQVMVPSRGLLLSDITGPLEVSNRVVASDGLSMQVTAAGSRQVPRTSAVWVRGEITHLAGVHLDLALRASQADLGALQHVLFPQAGLQLSGQASGDVRITGQVASPRVEGTITQASGQIVRQRFDDFSGQFQYYGGVLTFDDVGTSVAGGRVQGRLSLDVKGRRFFALATAHDVDLSRLRGASIPDTEQLAGTLSGTVAVAGQPKELVAEGYLAVAAGSMRGIAVDSLQTAFGLDRGDVVVERLAVRAGASEVRGSGTITASGQVQMGVTATRLDLGSVAGWFGLRPWLLGTMDAVGRLGGTLTAPVLAADVRVQRGRVGPLPFDEARGDLHLSLQGLQTSQMLLRDGVGRYGASGEVRWDSATVDLAVQAEGIPAPRLLQIANVPLALSGTVRGVVRLFGSLHDPQAAGAIELHQGDVQGQRIDQAQAVFRWTGSELVVDRAGVDVNASRIELAGRVARNGRVGLTFAGRGIELRDVAALKTDALQVAGAVDLSGTIGGSVSALTVAGSVFSTSLALNGQRFDRAEGQVRYQRNRLTLSPLVLRQGSGIFVAGGSLLLQHEPVLDLRVTAERAPLSTFLGLSRTRTPFVLGGTIDGVVVVSGRVSNPSVSVSVRLVDGMLGTHPIREAAVEASLANHALTLQRFSVTPAQGHLVGAGRIDLRGESDVEFSGEGLSLDLLRPLLGVSRPLSGTLGFTLQLSGQTTDPLVGLSAEIADGGIGNASFDQFTLQAFYQDGQFHIEQGLLQEGRHKARVEGTVPFNPARLRFDETRQMNLRLALGEADLSLLSLITDRVERASGPVTGEVLFTGTVAQPRMTGTLAVSNGTLKFRGIEPEFTALQAEATLSEAQLRLAQLQARSGAGTLSASGMLTISRFRPDRLNLTLTAEDARLAYAPLFAGTVDGTLRVEGPVARPAVGGSLTLSSGDVTIPIAAPAAAQSPPRSSDPTVDVELSAGDALWANLGGLRLQVHGTLRMTGTLGQPRLSGQVSSDRGSFQAFNTTFALVEGQATFAEFRGTTPFVDALAQTRVQRTQIFVHVQGTPEHLNMDLSSDPPLGQHEILALLGGQAGIPQLMRGDLQGALRAELSGVLFGQVGRAVAQALQLEEFAIEYDFAAPLQLRIGKLLVSTFYLTFASEFGTPPRYIWSLEYRLTSTTMFSLSADNFGRYDFLYRITYRF